MKKNLLCLLSLIVFIGACKKKDDDEDSSAATSISINSTPQASFKLDGTDVKITTTADISNALGISSSIAVPPDSSHASYSSSFYNDATSEDIIDIEKGFLRFIGSEADITTFDAFLASGNSAYVVDPETTSGVKIRYNANGTTWGTDLGTADQTGSQFKVVTNKKQDVLGSHYVTALINFNCKLYDGNGNSKTLTNGVFLGAFSPN